MHPELAGNQLPIDQSYQKKELKSLNSLENFPHTQRKEKSFIFNIPFLFTSPARKKAMRKSRVPFSGGKSPSKYFELFSCPCFFLM